MRNFFRDSVVAVAASGLVLCGLCLGFDTKAGAQGIELSIDGLAKELSEQAKMLGNVSVGLGNVTKRVAKLEKDTDGKSLQDTRDQVATIAAILRKRNIELADRVTMLEKKVSHVVNILKLQKENASK